MEMVRHGKIFKITVIMLCHFFSACYPQTHEFLSQNFCLSLGGIEDNLSCVESLERTGSCFPRNLLCDGIHHCSSGVDEGNIIQQNLICGEHIGKNGLGMLSWSQLIFFRGGGGGGEESAYLVKRWPEAMHLFTLVN